MKVPGWVDKLLKKKPQLEHAMGAPMGRVFGCGHFGCVFKSEPPWSVKLTRDPTEGPIWQLLADWMSEHPYGDDGIARVKEVVRLKPDIRWRRKEWPLYGIVREEVEPLLEDNLLSDYSRKKLGLGTMNLYEVLRQPHAFNSLPQPAKGNATELRSLLGGLDVYKDAAEEYHHAAALKRPSNRERRMDNAMEQAWRAINMMRGPVGGPIGETLSALTDQGVVLRDVHWNNIGWRLHESIGDEDELPLSLIIFDPGHTPTKERELRTEMLENPWPVGATPRTRTRRLE